MAQKIDRPTLEKRLDQLLKIVRYRDSENGETNFCATCKKEFKIKELQCGHFVKRGNLALKYNEKNLMPQCRRCNHFLGGAQDKAAYYVLKKYGIDCFNELIEKDFEWLDGKLKKPTKNNIVYFYNYWLAKNRETEQRLGIKIIPSSWEPAEY